MSKRSNSLRLSPVDFPVGIVSIGVPGSTNAEKHSYMREYEEIHGKQTWTKRTAENIAVIRAELGESWFQRWKLNKNNHGEAKRLGL